MNESRRQILLDTPHTETATGAIASFETDMVGRAKEVKVEIEPVQEGTPWIADTTESVPYNFRAVKGTAPRIGNSIFESVVGGTVAWNQLVKNGNFADGRTGWSFNNCTPSVSGNKVLITVTSGTKAVNFGLATENRITQLNEHKYLFGFNLKVSDVSPGTAKYNVTGSSYPTVSLASGVDKRIEGIFSSNGGENRFFVYPFGTTSVTLTGDETIEAHDYIMIDLTQMFGSTIADYIYSLETATPGAGVAWFRKLFPEDYYEYNPGELKSVEGVSSHETVGFNAWDEEFELGGISTSNGANITQTDRIRAKNHIHIVSGQTYYLKNGPKANISFFWYDAHKNFISSYSMGTSAGQSFTAPSKAAYLRFIVPGTTTYAGNICINLSDLTRNGTYEPYVKHSYPLDSTLTLRGIPKLDANNNLYYDGDTYESDGKVTRKIKEIKVTACDSVEVASTGARYATYRIPQSITELSGNNFLSNAYGFRVNAPNDGGKWFRVVVARLLIFDERFTDKSTTDTILASEKPHFVYELATPATETAASFQSPQVIDEYGTEEYVYSGTRDVAIPVGHVTRHADIYPISGWTGANVEARGKNLLDKSAVTVGKRIDSSYVVVSAGDNYVMTDYIPVVPGQQVTLSGVTSPSTAVSAFFDKSKMIIKSGRFGYYNTSYTGTAPAGAAFVACSFPTKWLDTAQLELGSTATSYEPYHGSTVPISWADEAGTVYGGTLEWLWDGTVKLTETMYHYKPQSITEVVMYTDDGTHIMYRTANAMPLATGITGGVGAKSNFTNNFGNAPSHGTVPVVQFPHSTTQIYLYFRIPSDMSPLDCEFVYALATPVTYTLTPQQALVFLRGTNNVWNDISDTTITYWTHKTGDSV